MAIWRTVAGLWWRVGRRGVSLLFIGSLGLVLAASLTWIPPEQAANPAYLMLAQLAPLTLWAAAWLLSGLLCWVQAFMIQDRIAYALASAMWWLYGLAYLVGTATGINPRGWVGGLIWLAFGAWVNLIATWDETTDVVAARARVEVQRKGDGNG